jgi:hypothetical protein
MANKILIKRSVTQGSAPTSNDLAVGELAVNPVDKRIYFKQPNNNVEYLQAIYASSITELADVDTQSTLPQNGDGLVWDTGSQSWIPKSVSEPVSIVGLDRSGDDSTVINSVSSFKFDSSFKILDLGNGTAKIQSPPKHLILYQDGPLQSLLGTVRWNNPADLNIFKIITRLTESADQSVDISINKTGIQVKQITIPTGSLKVIDLVDIAMEEDDFLTVDVNTTGTTASPGFGLSVEFFYVFT